MGLCIYFFFFFTLGVIIDNPLILCIILVGLASVLATILQHLFSVWMFNALLLIFLGGIIVLFLYISILSNNEKIYLPSRLVRLAIVFLGLAWLLSIQNYLNYNTSNSSFRSESTFDITLLYHGLITPHLIFLITVLIVALFCVVKITEGFKGSLIKNVDG